MYVYVCMYVYCIFHIVYVLYVLYVQVHTALLVLAIWAYFKSQGHFGKNLF